MLAARAEGSSGSEVRERKLTARSMEVREEGMSNDMAVLRRERRGLGSWQPPVELVDLSERLVCEMLVSLVSDAALWLCRGCVDEA